MEDSRQNFGVQNAEFEARDPRIEEPYYDATRPQTRVSSGLEQRVVFALVVFIAIFGLLLGFWSYAKNIREPFQAVTENTDTASETRLAAPVEDNDATLKSKDTDSDGLTDYDELKLWKTSPYIEDSDSDGYNDKEEADKGYDPNCPSGKDCGNTYTPPAIGITEVADETTPNFLPGVSGVDQNALLSGSASPADVRSLLVQLGMSEAQISQLSDEQIMELYKNTLLQVQATYENGSAQGNTTTPANPTTNTTPQKSDFENLSVGEVKALLLKGGLSEAQINQLNDAQLMQIYQATLERLE